MRFFLCAAAIAALLSSQALAVIDLRVTEVQMGIEYGSDMTDDWFEVTNFGDTAWTPAEGDLYYDDNSQDASVADQLFGISSIGPGESVIFVDEYDGDILPPNINILLWHDVWDTPLTNAGRAIPQVGAYAGSGLGNDGVDGATLFLDADFNGVDAGDLIDYEEYTNPLEKPLYQGRTWDGTRDFWSSVNVLGVDAGPTDVGLPHVGTPGYVVPEPSTFALIGLGFAALGLRRRK